MTPDKWRDEAEKIVQQYFDLPVMSRDGNDVQDMMDRVSKALSRAYREGRESMDETVKRAYLEGHEEAEMAGEHKGWNSAIDAAVKVALEYGVGQAFTVVELTHLGEKIADKIRGLKHD